METVFINFLQISEELIIKDKDFSDVASTTSNEALSVVDTVFRILHEFRNIILK